MVAGGTNITVSAGLNTLRMPPLGSLPESISMMEGGASSSWPRKEILLRLSTSSAPVIRLRDGARLADFSAWRAFFRILPAKRPSMFSSIPWAAGLPSGSLRYSSGTAPPRCRISSARESWAAP